MASAAPGGTGPADLADTGTAAAADAAADRPDSLMSVWHSFPLSASEFSSSDRSAADLESLRDEPATPQAVEAAAAGVGSSSSNAGDSWRPSQQEVEASPSSPVLVAANPQLPYQHILSGDPNRLPVNNGSPIEFESPMFSGRACVWIRGLPGAPDALFAGRRRRTLVTVQGRFRQAVPLDDLMTGQEFARVEHLPPKWLVEGVLLKVARALTPSSQVGPLSAPHMLMPVIAGCSEMTVSRAGEEPHPAEAPREDLRLWDADLATADGSPLPASQRKAHFSRPENRADRWFSTDLVYTFYFYQHVVDVSKYELHVLHRFNLCRYLSGQPLQLMMRRRSGEFLYCLHMWHSRLLPKEAAPAKP